MLAISSGPALPSAAAKAALALCMLAATPAAATQEYILPTLFDVTGVASDDVLNIRARPTASSEIIGTLAPDATRIEVVDHDPTGRWARINTRERSGWVSLAYLAYRTDVWNPDALPPAFACFGTEPFWRLTSAQGSATFTEPGSDPDTFDLTVVRGTGVFRDPRRALTAEGPAGRLTAVAVPALCSDQMSDRLYGLDATLVLEDGSGVRMLRGCCSIAP